MLNIKTRGVASAMASATKRLDPFAARLLSIRLRQKKAAGIKTDPAKTDTCCLNPPSLYSDSLAPAPLGSDSDEDEALVCNEPAFDIGPVSTGCEECGGKPDRSKPVRPIGDGAGPSVDEFFTLAIGGKCQDGREGCEEWHKAVELKLLARDGVVDSLSNMVKKVQQYAESLETRITELEQLTLKSNDGMSDTGDLP